ncbi:response regulator [Acaryochloris sp. CCMEE 5410]|uniref:response regulator n=1 Tax=Acaryochloris sp. CCMEE 5410 TaxID=310037 RepID=UPI0002484E1E|nr:response regulator [Acaryochloris sp. CCMEE 5410]KAI9133871.1 response regulator [Acaryochloris sp. CCMEE 5410]
MKLLLVEDDLADIELTQNGVQRSHAAIDLDWVVDGQSALSYLLREGEYKQKSLPSMILLDLNLPGIHGLQVLETIKQNDAFRMIPVIIFTTSDADKDIQKAYELGANCFIQKPASLSQYISTITSISTYWTKIAKLPIKS